MEILVQAVFLPHSGASKFYEVVTFQNPYDRLFVVVRRWGKITEFAKGKGQTLIETYDDVRLCNDGAASVIKGKLNRGYVHGSGWTWTYADSALYDPHNATKKIDVDGMGVALGSHYDDEGVIDDVLYHLGINDEEDDVKYHTFRRENDDNGDVVVEEPEVDHGGDWGSW